jgi:hypothetical protein
MVRVGVVSAGGKCGGVGMDPVIVMADVVSAGGKCGGVGMDPVIVMVDVVSAGGKCGAVGMDPVMVMVGVVTAGGKCGASDADCVAAAITTAFAIRGMFKARRSHGVVATMGISRDRRRFRASERSTEAAAGRAGRGCAFERSRELQNDVAGCGFPEASWEPGSRYKLLNDVRNGGGF